MKRILTYMLMAAGLIAGAVSCNKEYVDEAGRGALALNVIFDNTTRATTEELTSTCTINIYNSKGLIRTYTGVESMPSTLWLSTGEYRVDILAGNAVAASFDEKTYKGSQKFTISAGQTTPVEVECRINNVVAEVVFDASIAEQFSDYGVEIGGDLDQAASKLSFDASTATVGYFTLAEGQTALAWKFSGTHNRDGAFTKTGTVSDVEAGKKYLLTFRYTKGDPEGSLSFDIEVIKTTENIDDNIIFEADPTGAEAVNAMDVWATHATLRANVAENEFGSTGISIRVRPKNTEEWTMSFDAARESSNRFAATAKGLSSETEYEYQLVINGQALGEVKSFTTDIATALPNGGFEDWNSDSGYPLPYISGGQAWWGNGNKASSMLSKIISEPDETTKPASSTGARSAKLAGQHISILTIDKVAPGNLFSGYFDSTVGTSGGKVNFGRPFTARPSALKVFYKYNCGAITHNEGGPDNDPTPHEVGDPDRCHIYIMLGDWDYQTYGGTAECPVQVNTTDKSTFIDMQGPNVIAYGELVRNENVPDWTEATIRLKYLDTTRRPTHIIISCTSSKLGDYLTGSYNSILWVDDFELIYDEQIVTE